MIGLFQNGSNDFRNSDRTRTNSTSSSSVFSLGFMDRRELMSGNQIFRKSFRRYIQ